MECPWSNPDFDMPACEPCPVCGALGYDPEEVKAKCIDQKERTKDDHLFNSGNR